MSLVIVVGEIALLCKFENVDFFDDKVNEINEFPFSIIGSFDYLNSCLKNYDAFFVAIGENKTRFKIIKWLKERKIKIVSLIHPKSTLSKNCTLGNGICVMANAVINSGAVIGDGSIINTSSVVDHDCYIDKFVHISPNCSLSGGVEVGKLTQVGTGSAVHPSVKMV